MAVGAAFLILKCISSYLDCQYDSLSIDKCSKIGPRGPRYEEMLTNEKFIMKKKIMYKSHKIQHGKIITAVVECIIESGKTV